MCGSRSGVLTNPDRPEGYEVVKRYPGEVVESLEFPGFSLDVERGGLGGKSPGGGAVFCGGLNTTGPKAKTGNIAKSWQISMAAKLRELWASIQSSLKEATAALSAILRVIPWEMKARYLNLP